MASTRRKRCSRTRANAFPPRASSGRTSRPGRPRRRYDLVFANAALQFLPGHETLLPRLFAFVAEGGYLAVQMPITLHEASHAAMRLVAAEGPWARRLAPIVHAQPVIAAFEDYYEWLAAAGAKVEVWTTTYVHALDGVEGVVDWFAGSGLRPFLDPLDEAERAGVPCALPRGDRRILRAARRRQGAAALSAAVHRRAAVSALPSPGLTGGHQAVPADELQPKKQYGVIRIRADGRRPRRRERRARFKVGDALLESSA